MLNKKVHIKTYGCQMQVYDSDKMLSLLKPFGYVSTNCARTANLIILNTCHIREKADQKIYSELGRLRDYKIEQEAKGEEYIIAVGGCVAQTQGAEILRRAPYVARTFGPRDYHKLPQYLGLEAKREFPTESKFDYLPLTTETRASAFLTIQEGCNKFCSYCVVPFTRGREYSRPMGEILAEARHLVDLGALEITLLGQNVNAYHDDDKTIAHLIEDLAKIDGLKRIRYMTSHPRDMTDHLIDCHASIEKLMPQLHLPVQSGSDLILKKMNRKHKIDLYYDIISKLRIARPDIVISSDFIVGFPGETIEDHRLTLQLIQDCIDVGFSFAYSKRPKTPAAIMENQIPEEVKIERLYELQSILQMKQLLVHGKQIGAVNEILVEKKGKVRGQLLGKNQYLQSVVFKGEVEIISQIVPVKITEAHQNSLNGEIEK